MVSLRKMIYDIAEDNVKWIAESIGESIAFNDLATGEDNYKRIDQVGSFYDWSWHSMLYDQPNSIRNATGESIGEFINESMEYIVDDVYANLSESDKLTTPTPKVVGFVMLTQDSFHYPAIEHH